MSRTRSGSSRSRRRCSRRGSRTTTAARPATPRGSAGGSPAKALGGGLPISGLTGRAEIMDAPVPGSIGGTFGGNPLACVAAIENLRLIESSLGSAAKLGREISKRLSEIRDAHPLVGDVRGLGCMQALESVRDPKTKEPAKEETKAIQREARERGLLVLTAGVYDNVIRLLPPITMPSAAVSKSLDVLENSIAAVEKSM